MDLLLIRHGQADTGGRLAGRVDYRLSEEGRRQARLLADGLAGRGIGCLLSSPLSRALDTARIVGERIELEPIVLPELIERHGGVFCGLTREEAAARYPQEWEWAESHPLDATPGGESYADVAERAHRAVEIILRDHNHHVVAAVSHSGFLNVLLFELLGHDYSRYGTDDFHFSPAGISLLSVTGTDRTLRYANRTDHLAGVKVPKSI